MSSPNQYPRIPGGPLTRRCGHFDAKLVVAADRVSGLRARFESPLLSSVCVEYSRRTRTASRTLSPVPNECE